MLYPMLKLIIIKNIYIRKNKNEKKKKKKKKNKKE